MRVFVKGPNVSHRQIFIGVMSTAVLVVALLVWGWATSAQRPKFVTARLTRGEIESTVLATGILQPIRQVDVGTRVTGQLKKLYVKLDDHVRAGDLLAEMDPILPENELRAAQASLANLEAQKHAAAAKLQRSRREYTRQRGMIKGDMTSRKDLEAAEEQAQVDESAVVAIEAQIAQSKSQVEIASANLAYTKITAPIDGEIVGVITQEGQTVVATQTAPIILRLAQLDAMRVKTQVSEADITNVKPGEAVRFTVMGNSDQQLTSVLKTVELAPQSYSDPPTSQGNQSFSGGNANNAVFYNAWFETPNGERALRIGMTAQVSIVTANAHGVLIAPTAALSNDSGGNRRTVRVLRANARVEAQEVKIGLSNRAETQIIEGLKEGDEVIVKELDELQEAHL